MKNPMKGISFPMLISVLFAMAPSISDAADPEPMSDSQIERMHKRNKREAEKAWAVDQKEMKGDVFQQMETDYQEINTKYREPEIKEIIERFLLKYKEGNRVGCARMYLAQKTGGPDREKLLEKTIKENSESYYLDGCCVGGLARFYLASLYMKEGEKNKAKKWIAEIEKDYADAQDHSGKPIIDMARALQKE